MKKKKNVVFIIIGLVVIVLGYFMLRSISPMSASRYPFMLALLAIDVYLWSSIRKRVNRLSSIPRLTLTVLYWIPLITFFVFLLVDFLAGGMILSAALMTYIMGIVLVTYGSKLLAVVFFLLNDFIRVIHYTIRFNHAKIKGKPFERGKTMTRGRFLQNVGLAGGGMLLGGFLIGIVKWANDFKVRNVNLSFPNLPKRFNGMKIVQISDIHLGSWASTHPMQDAAEIVNSLEADLVLFTGDLVNFSTEEAYRFRKVLKSIKARQGIYAILGNHDYGDYVSWPDEKAKEQNMLDLYNFYDEIGWKLLRNDSSILTRGKESIALVGVENWGSHSRFPKFGDLDKALEGTEGIPFKLLMSHDPSHWEYKVSKEYPEIDLTLSGHTHGFQFGVEFKNVRWSLAQYVYKYWAGLYAVRKKQKEQYLYVNRGLGMVGYPGRVGILPEITVITLESEQS